MTNITFYPQQWRAMAVVAIELASASEYETYSRAYCEKLDTIADWCDAPACCRCAAARVAFIKAVWPSFTY